MINFIICEDNEKYREIVASIATNCMMKNELEYQLHIFDDYTKEVTNLINKKLPFKIYILDIELPSGSGIDIARNIRTKDVDSIIIFLTGHQELSQIVLKNDFLFLAFINKFDDCQNRLAEAIDKALQILKVRQIIRFKDGPVYYTIALHDILYITRDNIERKCLIITDYTSFKVSKTLTELMKMLNEDFIRTHRSCIVNKKRIVNYNKAKKTIMFDNGTTIDIISTRFAFSKLN